MVAHSPQQVSHHSIRSSLLSLVSDTNLGLDSNIWLWDLGSSRPIKKMTGHSGPITSLSFSAESSVLVSGSLDSTVRCWDIKSAGGEKSTSMRSGSEHDASKRRANSTVTGVESGELPLGGATQPWDGTEQTSVSVTVSSNPSFSLESRADSR